MKRCLFLAFALVFLVAGSVLADPPDVGGSYGGTGKTMMPPGFVYPPSDVVNIMATIKQDGNLFHGEFTITGMHPYVPGGSLTDLPMTGFIDTNNRVTGIISIQQVDAFRGIVLFEGKADGKTFNGVSRDLSDGSTTTFTLKKQ